ncbi:hypothetical protein H0H81_007740, partial [Sphagnurus paluster]
NRFAALEQLYQDRVVAAKYRQKIDTQKKTTEKYRLPENRTDRSYLTPDEREKHLCQGLCFKCHKKGHRSMDPKDGFIAKEEIRSTPASQEKPAQDPTKVAEDTILLNWFKKLDKIDQQEIQEKSKTTLADDEDQLKMAIFLKFSREDRQKICNEMTKARANQWVAKIQAFVREFDECDRPAVIQEIKRLWGWNKKTPPAPPPVSLSPVITTDTDCQSMCIPISLETNQTIETKALVDSGAGGIFIDSRFAALHQFPLEPLDTPI